MLNNKMPKKSKVIAFSVLLSISGASFAQSNFESTLMKIKSGNGTSEFLEDSEYKLLMENLAKKEALAKREARVKELMDQIQPEEDEKEIKVKEEQSLKEKLNPPDDATQVSIEFFDLMEKEFQNQLFQLIQENDELKARILTLKDPKNPEVMHNHIYVTETYSFGDNKYAKVFHDFHFNDMTEGEEIMNGVYIESINDRGIVVKNRSTGKTNNIYKTTRTRAIENAYNKKIEPENKYLNMRSEFDDPSQIDVSPKKDIIYPDFGQGQPPSPNF